MPVVTAERGESESLIRELPSFNVECRSMKPCPSGAA